MGYVLSLVLVLFLVGCQQEARHEDLSQTNTEQFVDNLDIEYRVVSNRKDKDCDPNQTDGLCFQGRLTLTPSTAYSGGDWSIYFSHMAPIQMEDSVDFDIVHINGDLHQLKPTSAFAGFVPGRSYDINFRAGFWHLSASDIMPNYYFVGADSKALVIPSTAGVIDPETGLEILPHAGAFSLADEQFKRTEQDQTEPATAQWLYRQNEPSYQTEDVTFAILPTPTQLIKPQKSGFLDVTSGMRISFDGISIAGVEAAISRLEKLGLKQSENGAALSLKLDDSMPAEAYGLSISETGIEIKAGSDTGAFYALQSTASLAMPSSLALPFVEVQDQPRFAFRGMHLDVARNFKSKAFVLQLLDQMAAYKLNKFHFHLADDEGWRVAIPGLPELTDVGAFRCYDPGESHCLLPQLGAGPDKTSASSGYYSTEDYKEILQYATARHIQVIPSMDMPGHSRAAIKAMNVRFNNLIAQGQPQRARQYLLHDVEDTTEYSSIQFYNDNTINACLDSSYDFIDKVISELVIMHQSAGQALTRYHIGADETAGAWVNSPACSSLLANNVMGINKAEDIAAYFIEKVSAMLAAKGIEAAGWSDGMGHTEASRIPSKVQSNAWTPLMWDGHKSAHEQANRGWQVVLSSPDVLYFDFPYEADVQERGYYWAARRINSKKVFQFMPENLPAHAEIWRDREERNYTATDDEPLQQGRTFYGIQGQLWSETVRTDKQASYMIFPRLYALAERAWHKADWELSYPYQAAVYSAQTHHFTDLQQQRRERDWRRFANQMGKKVLPKAQREGVFFRLPTPGAQVEQGWLYMNSIFPGLPLEYRIDRGHWQSYSGRVEVGKAEVEVRSSAYTGLRKGRALSLEQE